MAISGIFVMLGVSFSLVLLMMLLLWLLYLIDKNARLAEMGWVASHSCPMGLFLFGKRRLP